MIDGNTAAEQAEDASLMKRDEAWRTWGKLATFAAMREILEAGLVADEIGEALGEIPATDLIVVGRLMNEGNYSAIGLIFSEAIRNYLNGCQIVETRAEQIAIDFDGREA